MSGKDWPDRPWTTLDRDGNEIVATPPDGEETGWIEAEIAEAQGLLDKLRAMAENDKRSVEEMPIPQRDTELLKRNAARLLKFEQYIAECRARLRMTMK